MPRGSPAKAKMQQPWRQHLHPLPWPSLLRREHRYELRLLLSAHGFNSA